MQIARVFPRKTRATPTDRLAFYTEPELWPPDVDEVHVSVAFTWDLQRAEYLARAWERVAPVKIGGPATRMPGGDFEPGMYLKPGYVITSRGCPNRCWFCSVWKREGDIRELPIRDGWNVLDDNLLACSEKHIRAVFSMLKQQPERAQFTGGLEAARLEDWHIDLLVDLKPQQVFFAYDEPRDWEPFVMAARMMHRANFNRQVCRCYVLIGYPGDTQDKAVGRLEDVVSFGVTPMAMLWRDEKNQTKPDWRRLQKQWARPAIIYAKKEVTRTLFG